MLSIFDIFVLTTLINFVHHKSIFKFPKGALYKAMKVVSPSTEGALTNNGLLTVTSRSCTVSVRKC